MWERLNTSVPVYSGVSGTDFLLHLINPCLCFQGCYNV